jgi:hypothetical protein
MHYLASVNASPTNGFEYIFRASRATDLFVMQSDKVLTDRLAVPALKSRQANSVTHRLSAALCCMCFDGKMSSPKMNM